MVRPREAGAITLTITSREADLGYAVFELDASVRVEVALRAREREPVQHRARARGVRDRAARLAIERDWPPSPCRGCGAPPLGG